jgi:NAD(P)H-nitrite reductase large subunit
LSHLQILRLQLSEAGKDKKVAVIGTGLLGLEAANGLNELGFKVTVIGNTASIMKISLNETTPFKVLPGNGKINGVEPVHSTKRS